MYKVRFRVELWCFIFMFSFLSQETSGVDNYSEFKSKWNPDAFYPSTVLTFITEKLLPYWLQCKTCQKWRKIQNSHLKEENLIDKDLGTSMTFSLEPESHCYGLCLDYP